RRALTVVASTSNMMSVDTRPGSRRAAAQHSTNCEGMAKTMPRNATTGSAETTAAAAGTRPPPNRAAETPPKPAPPRKIHHDETQQEARGVAGNVGPTARGGGGKGEQRARQQRHPFLHRPRDREPLLQPQHGGGADQAEEHGQQAQRRQALTEGRDSDQRTPH